MQKSWQRFRIGFQNICAGGRRANGEDGGGWNRSGAATRSWEVITSSWTPWDTRILNRSYSLHNLDIRCASFYTSENSDGFHTLSSQILWFTSKLIKYVWVCFMWFRNHSLRNVHDFRLWWQARQTHRWRLSTKSFEVEHCTRLLLSKIAAVKIRRYADFLNTIPEMSWLEKEISKSKFEREDLAHVFQWMNRCRKQRCVAEILRRSKNTQSTMNNVWMHVACIDT